MVPNHREKGIAMAIGPVEYIIVGFHGNQFIEAAEAELAAAG